MGRVDAAMAKAAAARRAESDEHPAVAVAAPPVERERPPARQTASPTGVRVEDLDAEVSQKVVVDQRILAGSREQYPSTGRGSASGASDHWNQGGHDLQCPAR